MQLISNESRNLALVHFKVSLRIKLGHMLEFDWSLQKTKLIFKLYLDLDVDGAPTDFFTFERLFAFGAY